MDRTTEMLSTFTCGLTFDELGPDAVWQIKRTLIDTLGCAIGGFDSEPAAISRELALDYGGAVRSPLLGTTKETSPDLAAFANGVAIRYLDCNDSYFSPGGGHPSDMIAALLSAAAASESDGKAFLTSIALAYEVFCRLSDSVVASDLGWDQGIFSVIGAACGAAKLFGLDQAQTANAISLAITPNLPLAVTRTGELSMWKGCAAALASRSAVFAATLAGKGMTGPALPFDGRRGLWEQAVGGDVMVPPIPLGGARSADDPFRITRTIFKAYPSQIHTQNPIGLAVQLREQLQVAQIGAINIETYGIAASTASSEPEKWDPKTRETADHSIPWLVASALLDGPVNPGSFTDDRISSADIREVMSRMSLVEEPEFTSRYPAEYNCRITLTSHEGAKFAADAAWPRGHGKNPMSDSEVEGKFHSFSGGLLPQDQRDRCLQLCWQFENETSLSPLFDSLVIPG